MLKFEPRDKPTSSDTIVTLNTALWEKNCERDFYVYKGIGGTGSSLFQQNYEFVSAHFEELRNRGPQRLANTWFERSQLVKVERVCCRTFDDVLRELSHPFAYHFMKIDAQGAEYQILKGAEGFLASTCVGLHLELFLLPLYKGIKLLPEVVRFLENWGFELAKKFPAHGSFDSQHDCVFLKKGAKEDKVMKTIKEVYDP